MVQAITSEPHLGRSTHALKLAIFDVDGLLIDTEPVWRRVQVAVLASHGVAITEEDVRAVAGGKTYDIARHWIETYHMAIDPQVLTDEFVDGVVRWIETDGVALPGVYEAFELCQRHGVPMAIATSGTERVLNATMSHLKINNYFVFKHTALHEKHGKPFPDVFLTVARTVGVLPESCVVFEDSMNGIKAAKAAGMRCIAVPDEVNIAKPGFHTTPDITLASLEQLTWTTLESLFAE